MRAGPPLSPNKLTTLALLGLVAGTAIGCLARPARAADPAPDPNRIVLVVHGGAGTLSRAVITPEQEAQYRAALERALRTGHAVLASGGSSLDAVVATIQVFEDDPLFNAGKGAVFTNEGRNELDASIMDGKTGLAGAVAGVTTVKNPITAARAVMDRTKHVMLVSGGADAFAKSQGLEIVAPDYFFTQHRWDQLQKAREQDRIELDHDGQGPDNKGFIGKKTEADPFAPWMTDNKFGTVGAVALDASGNLAAGTSTGGLTNKRYGRVGDSPIIGAGTYADNAAVAVSCTGTGEFFMRGVVAYDIAARMKYAGASVSDAVNQTVKDALDARGDVVRDDAAPSTGRAP
jgi:L-asparaginase / beta-aspartyl-peptidase